MVFVPDPTHELHRDLHGCVEDYLYPVMGMDLPVTYDDLEEAVPYAEEAIQDDLETLEEQGILERARETTIIPLRTEGFERIAGELTGHASELVMTDPPRYVLGEEGERYVAVRELQELEESLRYVFQ